jgi:hypothetical protein
MAGVFCFVRFWALSVIAGSQSADQDDNQERRDYWEDQYHEHGPNRTKSPDISSVFGGGLWRRSDWHRFPWAVFI